MNKFKVRKMLQTVFFGFWLLILLLIYKGSLSTTHEWCPYSAICFGPMLVQGYGAYLISAIIGLVVTLAAIFVGRKFCGYLCFIGTIEEYIYKLNPQSKKRNRKRLPKALHKFLSLGKYITFAITMISAVFLFQYGYMKFCPVINLGFPTVMGVAGAISLATIFIGGFFIERFWCNYLCPYAALMNIVQFIGRVFKIKRHKIMRNMEVCIDCHLCDKNCPMGIDILEHEKIESENCIHCLRCLKVCPKDRCLTC